jgi:hypothetical protein
MRVFMTLNAKEALKAAKDTKKDRQISDVSPEKLIGYFPMKNINDKLSVKKYIDLTQTATDFRFIVFDMISALVYARLVHTCSKSKTYDEVIPKLFNPHDFSLNQLQLYDGLEYICCEYEKIIEIYNHQIKQMYKFDTSHTYFYCTNFYFEKYGLSNIKYGRKNTGYITSVSQICPAVPCVFALYGVLTQSSDRDSGAFTGYPPRAYSAS